MQINTSRAASQGVGNGIRAQQMTDYGRVPAKFAKEALTAGKHSGKRSKCAGRVFFDAQVRVTVADLGYTETNPPPPSLMRRRAHPRKKAE